MVLDLEMQDFRAMTLKKNNHLMAASAKPVHLGVMYLKPGYLGVSEKICRDRRLKTGTVMVKPGRWGPITLTVFHDTKHSVLWTLSFQSRSVTTIEKKYYQRPLYFVYKVAGNVPISKPFEVSQYLLVTWMYRTMSRKKQ